MLSLFPSQNSRFHELESLKQISVTPPYPKVDVKGMKENERVMDAATASSLDKTISFRVPVVYGIIEHDEEGDYLTFAAQCLYKTFQLIILNYVNIYPIYDNTF